MLYWVPALGLFRRIYCKYAGGIGEHRALMKSQCAIISLLIARVGPFLILLFCISLSELVFHPKYSFKHEWWWTCATQILQTKCSIKPSIYMIHTWFIHGTRHTIWGKDVNVFYGFQLFIVETIARAEFKVMKKATQINRLKKNGTWIVRRPVSKH